MSPNEKWQNEQEQVEGSRQEVMRLRRGVPDRKFLKKPGIRLRLQISAEDRSQFLARGRAGNDRRPKGWGTRPR